MLRMELQFYALFMTVLSGIGVGLLFDLLRAVRRFLRPGPLLAALGDLLFWGAATAMVGTGLFLGNWGEYRFYVLVGLLTGLVLHFALASPAVLWLADRLLHAVAWALKVLWELAMRLIWFPLQAVAAVLWRLGRGLGTWLGRRLRGPYRWLRLRYLLARRRLRRAWRRWFRGPKT
ncbi:MAG: spore cortex biosynthesis protein YabQ [Symbiobacterium thermophilum]|uniref:Spore cortex biosynthesis protein YabQ n=2 Tax=Symbiobacterium thermophilum TaxID=2734 RepID=A0A953I8P4_SYMTR|nr:spore cortex biosynthesis protein YabQ [Symbiobacterium thermophilum]